MDDVVSERHRRAARQVREYMALRHTRRDLVDLGAYRRGTDPNLDAALDLWPEIEEFLRQPRDVPLSDPAETLDDLFDLADV